MSEHKGQTLSWQIVNGAIELALHREPCNEIGSLMLDELESFVRALPELMKEAHALILHSTQPAGFSAGADLRELYHVAAPLSKAKRLSGVRNYLKRIHAVMNGEYWVGRESVSNLVQYLRNLVGSTANSARQRKFGLTPRELEIVSAVVAGYANKEIAEHFKISEDTVKHHLSNIFDKVGVSTRLELALFAVNQSLPFNPIN